MTAQPKIEYQYTLVPRGQTLVTASERRMDSVTDEYDTSYAEEGTARTALKRERCIDRYALRNHWDIVRLDVEYANPPWNSWGEFEDDMQSLDARVLFVDGKTLSGVRTFFISTEDGAEEDIANKMEEYFDHLNPIVETGHITVCPQAPLTEIEEAFPR